MSRGGFCFPPLDRHQTVSLPGGQFPNVATLMKHWESAFGGWKFTVIAAPQVGTLPHLLFDWTEHRVGIPGNETWLAGTWPGADQSDGCGEWKVDFHMYLHKESWNTNLKCQPKITPHILNQVLGLVNTLRILTYTSTERWILTYKLWNTFNECLPWNSAHPHPWTAAGCKYTPIVFAPLTAWRRDLWAGYLLLTSIPVRSLAERERDSITAHLFRCQINQKLLSC